MPMYEFYCDYCQDYFERQFSMAKVPRVTQCPNCKHQAKRQYTVPQMICFNYDPRSMNAEHDILHYDHTAPKRMYELDERNTIKDKREGRTHNIKEV